MLLCRSPGSDPINVLPRFVGQIADEAFPTNMTVEELKNAIDTWQERPRVFCITEKQVVIADLEDPVQGEAGNDLRNVRGKAGLCEAFVGNGGSKVTDALAHEPIVSREEVVKKAYGAAGA